MNTHIILGLFALYVAAVSLCMVLIGQQEPLLALLRRFWGRTLGHALYFFSRVALPLLICVLCLGWGVRHYESGISFDRLEAPLQLNLKPYRALMQAMQRDNAPDPAGVIHGA